MLDILTCSVVATETKILGWISIGAGLMFLAFSAKIVKWWDNLADKHNPMRNPGADEDSDHDEKTKLEVKLRKMRAANEHIRRENDRRGTKRRKRSRHGEEDSPWKDTLPAPKIEEPSKEDE